MQPAVLEPSTDEYRKLIMACAIFNQENLNGASFAVHKIYFDYGANWWWTTVLCTKNNGDSYQFLTPAQWEKILFCETMDDFFKNVDELLIETNNRGW
jgi:hypothetical protein